MGAGAGIGVRGADPGLGRPSRGNSNGSRYSSYVIELNLIQDSPFCISGIDSRQGSAARVEGLKSR